MKLSNKNNMFEGYFRVFYHYSVLLSISRPIVSNQFGTMYGDQYVELAYQPSRHIGNYGSHYSTTHTVLLHHVYLPTCNEFPKMTRIYIKYMLQSPDILY
jgi:hypothetical protein